MLHKVFKTAVVMAVGVGLLSSVDARSRVDSLRIVQLSIQDKYFKLLQQGRKTVEGRVNMPDMRQVQARDRLLFVTPKQHSLMCKVQRVTTYSNFSQMLVAEGVGNMLPGLHVTSGAANDLLAKAVALYRHFPGYAKQVKRYGALAFAVQCDQHSFYGVPKRVVITDD